MVPALPCVLEPKGGVEWSRDRRDEIEALLLRHGGVLLRGFDVSDARRFEAFLRAMGYEAMEYRRGVAPRSRVAGRIYNTSGAPPRLPIALHLEMAYSPIHPGKIAFCCETPARRGGATPIARMREVAASIPHEILEELSQRGIRYVQRLPERPRVLAGRTWPEMFDTDDRDRVEEICAEHEVDVTWEKDGSLLLVNLRPAFAAHPVTKERLFFNQVHTFHRSYAAELRHAGRWVAGAVVGAVEALGRRRRPGRIRSADATFADGSAIPLEWVASIRRAYWESAVRFSWQRGDLLLLDNHLVAHGRDPYLGPRRILAALLRP